MPPSEATNQATREEWRELGYFYDHEDSNKCWRLVGSKSGLGGFVTALRAYCEDPRNAKISEHDHYGPYMYLKVMTWSDAGIDGNSIHGTLDDLNRLAELMDTALIHACPGDTIYLGRKYVPDPEHDLLLRVKHDDFDPATSDPCLM
jgi:hypothetical protein